MFRQYKLRDFRLRLVMLVYAISILSVFVVGSAAEEYQNQQIMGIVIGSAAMLVLTFMDYRILLNFAWVIYIGNLVLLLLVDLIGQESNGAKRWLKLGFLRFQPSELTKLALIVLECLWIGSKARDYEGMLICCGFGGLIAFQTFANVCVATGMMPNTGVPLPFVSYGLTSLVMLYMGIGIVLNIGLQPKKY